MCFQGFVHFACGHSDIIEKECDLADDQPLYLKVACPSYRIDSVKSTGACGLGKYYCRQSTEGQYFEKVHKLLVQAQADVDDLDRKLRYLKATIVRFHTSANKEGVSMEARKAHPSYTYLYSRHEQFKLQRKDANEKRVVSLMVIQEAINHHGKRMEHILNGYVGDMPAFTLKPILAAKLPAELQLGPQAQTISNESAPFKPADQVVAARTMDHSAADLPHEGPNARRSLDSEIGEDIISTPRKTTQVVQDTAAVQEGFVESPISARKKGRHPRRNLEPNTLELPPYARNLNLASPNKQGVLNETSNVRRSARVRGKKVSYAESETSSISRGYSPEKSDISGFSPARSDQTVSPVKSEKSVQRDSTELAKEAEELYDTRTRRSGGSLGKMIGNWKRRSDLAAGAPQQQQGSPRTENLIRNRRGSARTSRENTGSLPATNRSVAGPAVGQSISDIIARSRNVGLQAGEVRPSMRPPNEAPPQTSFPSNPDLTGDLAPLYPSDAANFLPDLTVQNTQSNIFNRNAYQSMNMTQSSLPTQSGRAVMPQNQSDDNLNWLINTPSFNTPVERDAGQGYTHDGIASFGPATPMGRYDSAIGKSPIDYQPSKVNGSLPDVGYGSMWRSLSAAPGLTPPPTIDLTSTDTDPKKRTQLTSSPLLPSSKRVRLSLPGEDSTPNVYERALPYENINGMSSPSRLPAQQIVIDSSNPAQPPTALGEEAIPTPAPILAPTAAPTAFMYIASQQDEGGGGSDTETAALAERASGEEALGDETGVMSSDFDWSLINDDILWIGDAE